MHVVITGASSGIGAALAREFASHGVRLTLVARRQPLLEQLAAELSVPCHLVARDLSEPAQMTDWLAAAEAANGPVDVQINNAGVQIIGPTHEADADAGEHLLRLNVTAPMRINRTVLPGMLARGRGTVVDVASMAALAPTPGMAWYNASKAALAAASESLRGELRGTGVHVVTVYPGIIPTDMGTKGLAAYETTAAVATQPVGTAEELARRIRTAVEQRQDRVIYPSVYHAARYFPAVTRWFMDRFTPPLRKPDA